MKTIRNGFYTKYEGKEYKISKNASQFIELISDDVNDLQNGFIKFHHDYDIYKKQIDIKNIKYVYYINTFGVYKKKKFPICNYETEKQYRLLSDSSQEAIDFGFTITNKGESEKWVDKSEVAIFEEKELQHNFFKSCGIEEDASQEKFYKAFVGCSSQHYYVSRFLAFDANKQTKLSWHWAAFFMTFLWLIYRKMWLAALSYFVLPTLLVIFFSLVLTALHINNIVVILLLFFSYFVGIMLIPPLYANAWYYRHCQKKIQKAQITSPDVQFQLAMLSLKGGTCSPIIIFFLILFIIGNLSSVVIPRYQKYMQRTHLIRAVNIGQTASLEVSNFFQKNYNIPEHINAEFFLSDQERKIISTLEYNRKNGTIKITMAYPSFNNSILIFKPYFSSTNQITWKCSSPQIDPSLLPANCKN